MVIRTAEESANKKLIFKKKQYDKLITQTILRVIHPYTDKNKIMIDIGAQRGYMSYFFSNYFKRVIAFEAVPIVCEKFKKIVMEQKHNVELHNYALSNFNGEEKFYIDTQRLSNSSFQKLVRNLSEITVQARTLDSLNELYQSFTIGFIKIDTEGTELDVLQGAENTIQEHRPNLMIEIYEPFTKYPLGEIFDFMFKRDYDCWYFDCVNSHDLVRVPDTHAGVEAVRLHHDKHDGDFLFVPN